MSRYLYTLISVLVFLLWSGTVYAGDEEQSDVIKELLYQSNQEIQLQENQAFFILEVSPKEAGTMQPDLSDLRLFSNGFELGYAQIPLQRFQGQTKKQEQQLNLLNKGTADDGKYSFVMMMPSFKNSHLTIKLDKEPYLVKGILYGSQDNREWQNLQPITLFGIDNNYNEIPLNHIDYEYLKIEINQPANETLTVTEAVLIRYIDEQIKTPEEWFDTDITIKNQSKESEFVVDLHHQYRVSSEWILNTEDRGFYRQVITEGSNDQENWRTLGSSYIYRGVNDTDESISFRYGPEKYRYIRVRIKNEDNQPLKINNVEVKVHPLQILVKSLAEAKSFPLSAYWGNQNLQAPTYEVEEFITSVDLDPFQPFVLDQHEDNLNYNPTQPSIPLTERYPFLLPLVLIIAVGFISYILFRNFKQMKS